MSDKIILVLGGARSGKSDYAERLAEQNNALRPVYIATGQAFDDEMQARIDTHQSRRGGRWTTVEEPLELGAAIIREAAPDRTVLVDCLTLWLNNVLFAERDPDAESKRLITALAAATGPVILVSNEVGLGIVPENKLAREFRDHAGRLHQAIAAVAQRVVLVVAGQPLIVKETQN